MPLAQVLSFKRDGFAMHTSEYMVHDCLADDTGMVSAVVVFEPGVSHGSIMWKLANAMFGKGNWHVEWFSVDRYVSFPNGASGGRPSLGRWYARYGLAQGPSRVEFEEPRCDLR